MKIKNIAHLGLPTGQLRQGTKNIDHLAPIFQRFLTYFNVPNWDNCCNVGTAQLPVGFNAGSQELSYYNPETKQLVVIPVGGGGGGGDYIPLSGTEITSPVTGPIFMGDVMNNNFIAMSVPNIAIIGNGSEDISFIMGAANPINTNIGLVLDESDNHAPKIIAQAYGKVESTIKFDNMDYKTLQFPNANGTLVATVNGVAADVNGNVEVEGGGGGGGNYIPLSGTEVGSPVTGDIEISGTNGMKMIKSTQNGIFKALVFTDDDGITLVIDDGEGSDSQIILGLEELRLNTTGGYLTLTDESLFLNLNSSGASGIHALADYSNKLTDLHYVQKIYVDKQHSYSTTETLTGGTWIDGKPIYRKTFNLNNFGGTYNDPITGFFTIDLTAENIETCLPINGNFNDGSYVQNLHNAFSVIYDKANKKVVFFNIPAMASDGNLDWRVIVEYTKTTD